MLNSETMWAIKSGGGEDVVVVAEDDFEGGKGRDSEPGVSTMRPASATSGSEERRPETARARRVSRGFRCNCEAGVVGSWGPA